jgi:hypothetical protein
MAPVHAHAFATHPQPQPQSALTAHVFVGATHLVASLLQLSPIGQALVFVHDWQAPLFVHVWMESAVQRVAPSVGHGSALSQGCATHIPAMHERPAHAGPQSVSTAHEGGIAPVHSHALATQPQPQPQSALVVQAPPPVLVDVVALVVAEVLPVAVALASVVLPPAPPPAPPVLPAMTAGVVHAAARKSVAMAAKAEAEREERRSDMVEPPVMA